MNPVGDDAFDVAERINHPAGRATALWFPGYVTTSAPEISFQLSWLGRIAMLRGEHERAWQLHERARILGAEQGFKPAEMYAETGLGLGARRTGQLDVAEKHLHHMLEWHRTQRFDAGIAFALAELGFVAEERGDQVTARWLQRQGFELARDSGDPRATALALEGLAVPTPSTGSTNRRRDCSVLRPGSGIRSAAHFRLVSATTLTASPTL